jgi:F1F0 ATPase subunit 2
MIDPEFLALILIALAAGAGLGVLFFGTLWVSVRTLANGGGLSGLVLGAVLRAGIVLAALAWALAAELPLPVILAGLCGFFIARQGAAMLARASPVED